MGCIMGCTCSYCMSNCTVCTKQINVKIDWVFKNSATKARWDLLWIACSLSVPSLHQANRLDIIIITCVKKLWPFLIFRLEFPFVLVLYQDIFLTLHGITTLIGFIDRRLFCTSDDLLETFNSSASPFCTFSGKWSMTMCDYIMMWVKTTDIRSEQYLIGLQS